MKKIDIYFTKIIDSFSKLINVIKKNGIIISTWSAILIIMLYTFLINPLNVNELIKNIKDQEKETHSQSVDKRLIADELIPEILDKLRIKYNVDRVSLMEMHNSTSNINDVSFLYMSLIYESIDAFNDSIPYISDQYQSIRTSEYSFILKELNRKGHLYINKLDSCENYNFIRIAKKMTKNGTKSVLFYPLFNGKRIDGMLIFSSTKDDFDYKNILLNINKPVAKIKKLIIIE